MRVRPHLQLLASCWLPPVRAAWRGGYRGVGGEGRGSCESHRVELSLAPPATVATFSFLPRVPTPASADTRTKTTLNNTLRTFDRIDERTEIHTNAACGVSRQRDRTSCQNNRPVGDGAATDNKPTEEREPATTRRKRRI